MTSHRSHPPVSALRERMIEDITVRGIGEKTRHDHTLRHSFATHCWSRTSTPTPIVSAVFPMALAAEIDRSTSAHQLWRRRRARLPPCGGRCAAAPLAAKPLQPTRDALARALDALETLLAALADRDQLGLDLAAALDRQADRIGSLIAHCGSSLPSLFLPGPRFCPWSGITRHIKASGALASQCLRRGNRSHRERAATYAARSPTPPSRQGQPHRRSGVPAKPGPMHDHPVPEGSNLVAKPSRRRADPRRQAAGAAGSRPSAGIAGAAPALTRPCPAGNDQDRPTALA
jgi:hypothetical protein